ncbi:MAG: FtsX-like permease family protein [Sphingobacteriales bacterium]|nr:FtsX-like permease family protein [Sphingobacteriales bacterium]OJY86215.1 MAG: permease [Sphingobacteriales bacterium 44-15]
MILKLAIRNLLQKPLTTLLSWVLLTVSVGIISMLLLLQGQFEKQFTGNIKDVDMVIGAKGSPLQLILSAIYHIDAPTGNIKYAEAEKWMQHPYVEKAIPLAYGDSYKGYSIVGTTKDYLDKYSAKILTGSLYESDFEVVAGYSLAKKLHLQTGSQFYSTHGTDGHGEEHKDKAYTVTGILQPAGTVVDNLFIGNIESVWKIHEHHHHDDNDGEAVNASNAGSHGENDDHHGKELTAVLLKFRTPVGSVQLPRIINSQTNMMAAVPAIEMNRLFSLTGIGIDTLQYVGWGIMALSALSIFISLFNSLKERKYELALMRTMGAKRVDLLMLLVLESVVLCIAGFIAGILLSRLAIWALSASFESSYHFEIQPWTLNIPGGVQLLVLTLLLGMLAASVPAIKAWFINISKTLTHE